jgi:general secretion pathway protein G
MSRLRFGFTLIELLVVMAIIATLLTIASPRYFGSLERSKENTLKQSLAVMRDAIDKYYSDNGQYPEALADLASKRYLRAIPVDPITGSAETWTTARPPQANSIRGAPLIGGVYDVHSGAAGHTEAGVVYSSL